MNPADINRITAASVVDGSTVELQFSDGFVGRIDLAPQLWGPVFGPLKDSNYFRQFRLENDAIRWPNDADFCPDVLRYSCEAGVVRSEEETDAYFVQSLETGSAQITR